ncbi:MAG: hypothetical protein JSS07_08240 [Proteobacteria bacterium]|nr:hypothetical protein [Pseudomonadota bacterium]
MSLNPYKQDQSSSKQGLDAKKDNDSSFELDTRKLYRIWYTKNPEVYLNGENKIRLIGLKHLNLEAKITLIYSSLVFSPTSLSEFNEFCARLKIDTLDFDTQLPALLKNDLDKEIYQLARSEIKNALNNKGGNLGASSDCTRTLVPIIENFGIYSDFEPILNFSSLPPRIGLQSAFILPIEKEPTFSFNIDFFAVAQDSGTNKIAQEALMAIRLLQIQILEKYKNPFKALIDGCQGEILAKDMLPIITDYFKSNIKSDIFAFREYILQKLPPNNLQKNLYKISVTAFSGPKTWLSIFTISAKPIDVFELMKKAALNTSPLARYVSGVQRPLSREEFMKKGLELFLCSTPAEFKYKNNELIEYSMKMLEISKNANDCAWTAHGEEAAKIRSKGIEDNIVKTQSFCRAYLAMADYAKKVSDSTTSQCQSGQPQKQVPAQELFPKGFLLKKRL